jgi:hypothetical protein
MSSRTAEKIAKTVAKAERSSLESYFARVNWRAHLVPVLRGTYESFHETLRSKGIVPPAWFDLGDDIAKGSVPLQSQNQDLGESISIQFGVLPLAAATLALRAGLHRVLAEERAALVFSQTAASGEVAVFIYPPSSSVSEPSKAYYLVDHFTNPRSLTVARAERLLHELLDVDLRCSTQASTLSAATLLAKVEARERSLDGGKSELFRYVKYAIWLARGLWRIGKAYFTGQFL